ADGQLRLHHRLPHLPRQVAQVSRRCRRIQGGAQPVSQALEHRRLAFPDRFREKRREHLLHRVRLAFGAGRPLASVLRDSLLPAEARAALRAAILVDRHGGLYDIPRGNRGQVDAVTARRDDCTHAESRRVRRVRRHYRCGVRRDGGVQRGPAADPGLSQWLRRDLRHGDGTGHPPCQHAGSVHRRVHDLPRKHQSATHLPTAAAAGGVASPLWRQHPFLYRPVAQRTLRVGARGVAEEGDAQTRLLERRLAVPGGWVLQRCRGHDLARVRDRRRQRQRHGLDRLRDRLRQHAPHLHLLPAVPVRSLLPVALAMLLVRAVSAQETAVVYGTVRDSSGQPVRATVRVVNGDGASAADAQGRYHLRVPAALVIVRVGFLGFQSLDDTLTLAAGDSLERDYRLARAIVPLEPVIVTAAKRSQLLSQAVTSVALVTDTAVARRAITTVDEAVDKAPGVQFLNGQVNIRGSSGYVQGLGSRVLMLVDGVPANQGDRGGINWDLVPLEDVARVEVVKGAGSALYGSAALGGVVNVITRDIPTGFHARGRVVGGWFADPPHDIWKFRDYRGAQEGLEVTTSYGTDVARASFTAGGWHSDGYREQDRRNHWQTAGKAQWAPSPETQVTASGSWASDQYETPLIWCTQGSCDDRGQAFQPFMIDASGRGAFTRSDKGLLAATLEHRASERFAWQARGSWGRTD